MQCLIELYHDTKHTFSWPVEERSSSLSVLWIELPPMEMPNVLISPTKKVKIITNSICSFLVRGFLSQPIFPWKYKRNSVLLQARSHICVHSPTVYGDLRDLTSSLDTFVNTLERNRSIVKSANVALPVPIISLFIWNDTNQNPRGGPR